MVRALLNPESGGERVELAQQWGIRGQGEGESWDGIPPPLCLP